jgi:hypothetical protein
LKLNTENPRILVWMRSAPDQPSGSPAIIAELLRSLEPGSAEIVCEWSPSDVRRDIGLRHPISRIAMDRLLWPFKRGTRIRQLVRYLSVPIHLAYGLFRVARLRPQCIVTVYFDAIWILTSYLLSRLTGVPVLYYVHDPFLEAAEHRGGLDARLAGWVEARWFNHGEHEVIYT